MKETLRKIILKRRVVMLMIGDIFIINFSAFLALWIRFELSFSKIDTVYLMGYLKYAVFHTIFAMIVFFFYRLYTSLWSYASVKEFASIIFSCIWIFIEQVVGMRFLHINMPYSYYLLSIIFMGLLVVSMRFSYRFFRRYKSEWKQSRSSNAERVMLIGAGEAGMVVLREINSSKYLNQKVLCVIDDDVKKHNRYIQGIPVVGGRESIEICAEKFKINKIIIALPRVSQYETRAILDICKRTTCELQILPGVYQLIDGEVNVSKLKKVEIEDLLGRKPEDINLENVLGYVKNKVVLVTGGGGSIGSELCRQLATHEVGQLIIFDMYENNAYDIQLELQRKHPELDLKVLIGSVRNTNRLKDIFSTYKPQIVFHAAAHKHVPLMEDSPNEAVKNNVIGTYKTAFQAERHKAECFVLISSDKAVNPTNIMGASKRLCEMVIQSFAQTSQTVFTAVRFGNVLGSNGSVIPLFKKQIKNGGPVTVTHPDIIRYFMTISEAVSLVLQAGAYANGGEIFILDMGEPVKILDLAKNLIRLSGYEVDKDIKIEITGLRPGEKLYEELLMAEEGMRKTENQRIYIGNPLPIDSKRFVEMLRKLDEAAWMEHKDIRRLVSDVVPEYRYQGEKMKKNA